jgi:hypothetical protein
MRSRSPRRSRVAAWRAALLGLVAMVGVARPAPAQEASEYAIKAAYLYKLGDYVEWPASSFAGPGAPVGICIVGTDPFGGTLDATIAGEKSAGRPIALRRLRAIERGSGCHIAYLGGSDQQSVAQALEAVKGTPVLTITDEARGAAVGIVHFLTRSNRVRFQIDDQAAADNALNISSKLFSIALSVKPRR